MTRRASLIALLCLIPGLSALAGCASQPPEPRFGAFDFADRPPIKLDVHEIAIEQAYRPPLVPPNVEHLFHVAPAEATERWAEGRLAAVGPMNRARFVIREASVVEVPLEQSGGVTGAFTTEQSERYDARLVVDMEITSEGDASQATLTVEVTRNRTVPENLTLNERELVWHEMTQTMLQELGARLEEDIRKVFVRYLVL